MDILYQWDLSIFQLINSGLSSAVLDTVLVPFRHKLFWIPLYLFLIIFIYLNFRKSWPVIFLCITLCITASDTISSKLIKDHFQRLRPCNVEQIDVIERVPCSKGYSFTSSHATNHFAISSFLFLLFSFWRYRILFIIWAALISFAQVYVGVHYPSDVIAGSTIGCLIGILCYYLYCLLFRYTYTSQKKQNDPQTT